MKARLDPWRLAFYLVAHPRAAAVLAAGTYVNALLLANGMWGGFR